MGGFAGISFDAVALTGSDGRRHEWRSLTGLELAPPLWTAQRGWDVTFFFGASEPVQLRSAQTFGGRECVDELREILRAAATSASPGAVISPGVWMLFHQDATGAPLPADQRGMHEARAQRAGRAAWREWRKLGPRQPESAALMLALVEETGHCPRAVLEKIESEILRARDPQTLERMARIFSALDSDLAEFYARGGGKAGPSGPVARGYVRWLFRRGREAEAETLLREAIERTTDAGERQALTADLWVMQAFQADPRKRAQVRRPRQWRIGGAVAAALIVAGFVTFEVVFARHEQARRQEEAQADSRVRRERAQRHLLPGTAAERRRFTELQVLAKNGDVEAMYELSRHYRTGRATPFDAQAERQWLEQAAKKNHALAERTLAHWYRLGRGGAKVDRKEAFTWMERAAAHGDAEAPQWIIYFYVFGDGVAEDRARALQQCQAMAAKNQPWAKAELPLFSLYGRGVPKDEANALVALQREADAGNADAWEALGIYHEREEGGNKDYPAAARCYEQASNLGHIRAKAALARLLYRGQGVSPDLRRAEELARAAAVEDSRVAQNELALILLYGIGTPEARREARYWAERALNENSVAAQRTVAELLLWGKYSAPDAVRARGLIRAHAESGNASSMARFAVLLRLGIGGPKNGKEALRWWNKAVDAGNVAAMLDLAEVYAQGDVSAAIFADRREAKRLLELAVAKGSEEAKKRLKTLSEVTAAPPPEEVVWVAPKGAWENLPENGQPVVLRQSRPTYPFEMRRQNVAGEVLVDFIVSERGQPLNAVVISATREEFREPALRAVRSWAFRPGTKNGRAVRTHMQVPIVFSLEEESASRAPKAGDKK